jgi:hypothetical protein
MAGGKSSSALKKARSENLRQPFGGKQSKHLKKEM